MVKRMDRSKAEKELALLGQQEAGLRAIKDAYRFHRNKTIKDAHEQGVPVGTISRIMGMSRQAVYLILNEKM